MDTMNVRMVQPSIHCQLRALGAEPPVEVPWQLNQRRLLDLCGLADGSSNWVDSLVSGRASKREVPESAHARGRVPRPTAKLPVFRAPAPPSRKPHAEIVKDTKEYEREQYVRTGPLPDGPAERAEAQLLFEHGRKRLQEMKTLEQERRNWAAAHIAREPDSEEMKEALLQQVKTLPKSSYIAALGSFLSLGLVC